MVTFGAELLDSSVNVLEVGTQSSTRHDLQRSRRLVHWDPMHGLKVSQGNDSSTQMSVVRGWLFYQQKPRSRERSL